MKGNYHKSSRMCMCNSQDKEPKSYKKCLISVATNGMQIKQWGQFLKVNTRFK